MEGVQGSQCAVDVSCVLFGFDSLNSLSRSCDHCIDWIKLRCNSKLGTYMSLALFSCKKCIEHGCHNDSNWNLLNIALHEHWKVDAQWQSS